jgi:hypothetical protein
MTGETVQEDAQKARPARPQLLKKAEVEVKVKRRGGSSLLNLSLSLDLPITLAGFFSILINTASPHHPVRHDVPAHGPLCHEPPE